MTSTALLEPDVELPYGGWEPRWYQLPVWKYLENGGRHAELIWHRRAGKDEICLNWAATQMVERPATYWHMLPLANQVRKAIWDAVNPHTGVRRILEAFPEELFTLRDTDMLVRCKRTAGTWQCLGSDNFQGAIGSPPLGITYSEWAQANPSCRGYLRPIIAENGGWQLFISTPRGKNHAHSTYKAAERNPNSFAELLTIHDTHMLTPEQLIEELMEYCDTYGEVMGLALYEQEYECSFEAAIIGAYYGAEFKKIDKGRRICTVPLDDRYPVHVAMDIGYDDDTAIWWFQVIGGEPHILEYYYTSGEDAAHYCGVLAGRDVEIDLLDKGITVRLGNDNEWSHRKHYRYGSINLPHDAKAKTLAAKGKSVEEQFAAVWGWGTIQITPGLSFEDGIRATRQLLKIAYFDESCEDGIEACRQYHREWDDDKKMFKDKHFHDWTSHPADALRYLAVCWSEDKLPKEALPPRWKEDRTFEEMVKAVGKRKGKR